MSSPITPRFNTLPGIPNAPARLRLARQTTIPLSARNLLQVFNEVEQEHDFVDDGLQILFEREQLYDLSSDESDDEEMYDSSTDSQSDEEDLSPWESGESSQ